MLKILSRLAVAFMLLAGALFIFFTLENGTDFPIVLFPLGMIISGLGSFLHGPMDPLPTSFKDFSITEIVGNILLFAGMLFMISAAVLKAFG